MSEKETKAENQNFNENELQDIMSEIESLEEDFNQNVKPKAEEALDAVKVEEELAKLEEEAQQNESPSNSKKSISEQNNPEKNTVVPMQKKSSSAQSPMSMEFHVSGEMKLNLKFNVAGQSIQLGLDEKEGLVIEMDQGAKFVLPLNPGAKVRKAS